MRSTRLFKAETFRVAALFTLLFLAMSGALLAAVVWIVDGTQRRMLGSANQADIATVSNGFQDEGLEEAVEVVRQRLGSAAPPLQHRHALTPEVYMLIDNLDGSPRIGNLPAVACQEGQFTLTLPPAGGHHGIRRIVGSCAPLGAGARIYVGRDTALLAITRARILRAFGWLALGTCGFAVVGGSLLGRRFMQRVDAVTQTCERVVAGRLEERIPLRGRGDEWDRLAGAINDMLDRISALLDNLRQVSSDVAHDLRTPLTRLRNRLEQARAQATGQADYSIALARAIEDTDQLLSLFAALLRISQVEAGTRAQSFGAVSLSELLEHIFQLYLPVAEDCRRTLTRTLRPAVFIRGDEELLTQLFSNLIENALRHTPEGTRIGLSLQVVDDLAVATLSDDGPGVPPAERDKILRRFYRLSHSRSSEGHGLGLALVAAIAQLHGARLTLHDAAPGLGVSTAFKLTTKCADEAAH